MCVVDLSSLDVNNDSVMKIIGQATSDLGATSSLPHIKNMWAVGGEGLTMFHSSDDKFSIALAQTPALTQSGSQGGTQTTLPPVIPVTVVSPMQSDTPSQSQSLPLPVTAVKGKDKK